MTPKSHTLFHFTKSNATLKLLLKNGLWPRYCLEDINWLSLDTVDFVAFPMTCFCDIPLSRVEEHVKFYGEYGVGLTKEWALRNSLTPVHYIAPNNDIPSTYHKLISLLNTNNLKDEWKLVRYLLAHTKPLEGNMVVSGAVVTKEFHQESEWRFIPKHEQVSDYLKRTDFEDDEILEEKNNLTREYSMLKIEPKDIKYIFVKNDFDIPDIINFIQTELDNYASSDLKVLMSRVTSLESINRDM